MAELGQFSNLPSGQAGTGQDNVKASFRLRLAPTGIGDFSRAGVGSPRIGRPGDWNHADLHISAADPHFWQ